MGIASALGIATVVAPISGLMTAPSDAKPVSNELLMPRVAAPAFSLGRPVTTSVETLTLVPDNTTIPSVIPGTLAAPRDLLVTGDAASRGHGRAVLPGCTGVVPAGFKPVNGALAGSALCTLWDGEHQLRADAAVALAKLNVAYQQTFGHPMCLSDGYRTLSQQVAVKAERGYLAARPGTSVHGLGRAVDLCDDVETFGSRTHQWMVDNAPRYGWINPDWALPGGSGPTEAWHWEWNCGNEVGCESTSTGASS